MLPSAATMSPGSNVVLANVSKEPWSCQTMSPLLSRPEIIDILPNIVRGEITALGGRITIRLFVVETPKILSTVSA